MCCRNEEESAWDLKLSGSETIEIDGHTESTEVA